MARIRVAAAGELSAGAVVRVDAGGTAVCLVRAEDGELYALSDICTHEYASLSEGDLYEMSIECPLHGSSFDVRTGAVTGLPATDPATTYPVTVIGEDVYVEL